MHNTGAIIIENNDYRHSLPEFVRKGALETKPAQLILLFVLPKPQYIPLRVLEIGIESHIRHFTFGSNKPSACYLNFLNVVIYSWHIYHDDRRPYLFISFCYRAVNCPGFFDHIILI